MLDFEIDVRVEGSLRYTLPSTSYPIIDSVLRAFQQDMA